MTDATKIRMSQVIGGLQSSESESAWSSQILQTGAGIIHNRPVVRVADDSYAITNWKINEKVSIPDNDLIPQGAILIDGVNTGTAHLYVPKSVMSLDEACALADRRYLSYTFVASGGSPSTVEQYDDVAEAISALQLGRRYDNARVSYRCKDNGEAVHLSAVSGSNKATVVADIIDSGYVALPNGTAARLYESRIKHIDLNGKSVPIEHSPEPLKNLIRDICEVRMILEKCAIRTEGHRGTKGFFIPSGWAEENILD